MENNKLEPAAEEAIQIIIRPDRYEGDPWIPKKSIQFEILNPRNLKIKGFYYPALDPLPKKACVIGLHGNGGNCDMVSYFYYHYVKNRVAFACFDFSGCGKSEGEYISLGFYEKDDVIAVMDYLRNTYQIEDFGLHGYSMGAATALRVLAERPEVKGAILDSPYTSIIGFLGPFMSIKEDIEPQDFYEMIREEIQKRAHFDIFDNVIDKVENIHQPVIFVHGEYDTLVPPHMSEELLEKCSSEKKVRITFPGQHNSFRSQRSNFVITSINFLLDVFGAPQTTEDLTDDL